MSRFVWVLVFCSGCYPFIWAQTESDMPQSIGSERLSEFEALRAARMWATVWGSDFGDGSPPWGERLLFYSAAHLASGTLDEDQVFVGDSFRGQYVFDVHQESYAVDLTCTTGMAVDTGCGDGPITAQLSFSSDGSIGGPNSEDWLYVDYARTGTVSAIWNGEGYDHQGQSLYQSFTIYQDGEDPIAVDSLVIDYELALDSDGLPTLDCLYATFGLEEHDYEVTMCANDPDPVELEIDVLTTGDELDYLYYEDERWVEPK